MIALVQASRPHVTAMLESLHAGSHAGCVSAIAYDGFHALGKDDYSRLLARGCRARHPTLLAAAPTARTMRWAKARQTGDHTCLVCFTAAATRRLAYRILGVDACVTNTADDYIAQAVQLANDAEYLQRSYRRKFSLACPQLFDDGPAVEELQERLIRNLVAGVPALARSVMPGMESHCA